MALQVALLPVRAFALQQRSIQLTTGVRISFVQAMQNILTFLAASIVTISTVLFLVGAVFIVASAGKPELLEKGKKTMRSAVTGMAIVLGSYAILRTVLYFLYI
jgi:hypothetical protein